MHAQEIRHGRLAIQMLKIAKALALLLMCALLPALLLADRDLILALDIKHPHVIALLGGAAAYVLFSLFSRNIEQWHFHVHELAHMLAALCFFARIDEFHVSRKEGGYVTYSGSKGNPVISLAPYCLPILCLPPLGLLFLVQDSYVVYSVGALGFAWAFHLDITFRQTRPYQTDIQQHGLWFSFVTVTFTNVLTAGVLASLTLAEPGIWAAAVYAYVAEGAYHLEALLLQAMDIVNSRMARL